MKKINYKVWLVRSPEFNKSEYWNVINLLKSIPGVIKFYTKEKEDLNQKKEETEYKNSIETSQEHSWFFDQCNTFRDNADVGETDMVILLTDLPNKNDYFLRPDDNNKLNAYIQTSGYNEYFPGCDIRHPIAFHIAITILIMQWFDHNYEAERVINKFRNKGGILDYCTYKKDVILKLRTADLSQNEIDSLIEKKVDPNLILTVLEILEKLRSFMLLKNRWQLAPKPLAMTIDNQDSKSNKIYFEELGNIAVNLDPIQLALYLTFLTHKDGIINKKSSQLGHAELRYKFYNEIKSDQIDKGDPGYKDRKDMIDKTWTTNNFSIQISKIKKEFINVLGTELAKLYYISTVGKTTQKKVAVDRKYIKIIDWKGTVQDTETYLQKYLQKTSL